MRTIATSAYGVGLRTEHLEELAYNSKRDDIDFLELAPENWMSIGGAKKQLLQKIAEKYPLIAHGLSLSLGASVELNIPFLSKVTDFLDDYNIQIYSDHLSFSQDQQGYLYELLPIPRYQDVLPYLVDRIHQVQDITKRPLVLENISYYHTYPDQMPEDQFMIDLLRLSDCKLLLDINNVYVNSVNHNYDPFEFIKRMPTNAISYYHLAGHLKQADNFLLDTHGKNVTPEVLELAKKTIKYHGVKPLLLERDHHVPPLETLCKELSTIKSGIKYGKISA